MVRIRKDCSFNYPSNSSADPPYLLALTTKPPQMKKYFLKNEEGQIGPFSPEELKEKGINASTPIWYEGLEHWTTAGELEELKELFSAAPAAVTEIVSPDPTDTNSPEPEAASPAQETISSSPETVPNPAEPIVTAATTVTAAPTTAAPARKRGNPVISWVLSLAVLGGTGYYVYQDMEKNKGVQTEITGTTVDLTENEAANDQDDNGGENKTESDKTDQGAVMPADTVTAPVKEEKELTQPVTTTVPVTDAKNAEEEKKKQALAIAKKKEEDKKKQLAAEAKKKEEEKKKQQAAQAQAAKEMEMRNAWPRYVTIGSFKIEGDDKVKPFSIPVINGYPVALDKVVLRVDYLKKEKIVASETLTLGSIPAKGNLAAQATGNKKGKTANVYITAVSSRALHFCYPSTGGKAGDQYFCN